MANSTYVRRYSQAMFRIALEARELNRWQSDLKKIVSLVEDATIVTVLESPKFHFDDKVRMLSELLDGVSPLALNMVNLLVRRSWKGQRRSLVGL